VEPGLSRLAVLAERIIGTVRALSRLISLRMGKSSIARDADFLNVCSNQIGQMAGKYRSCITSVLDIELLRSPAEITKSRV
jgi:hypothetical protein